uniref:Uncharacterized protein n=1 Tax=Ditylenchus dipsaci TaxID=166011 RepID=A0A915EKV3_9BILA
MTHQFSVIKMKLPSDHTVKEAGGSEKKDKEAQAEEGKDAAPSPDVHTMKDTEEAKKDADSKKRARLVKLPEWAFAFFKDVNKDRLFSSARLGNLLEARKFVDHITFFIADELKKMNVTDMRKYLNVTVDFEEGEFNLLNNEKSWRDLLLGAGVVSEEAKKDDQDPK